MIKDFQPNGLPTLLGSLPIDAHDAAAELVFKYTPDIPVWAQLPGFPHEGMVPQFLPGIPGLAKKNDSMFVDTASPNFDSDLLAFYEEYIAVQEGEIDLYNSRFILTKDVAEGFFVFLDRLKHLSGPPAAVKGQITGPITFCLGLTDQNERAVFYNETLRDAAVKLLAQKARWQAKKLGNFGCPVLIFLDEPAMAGFGSSAFISISGDEVSTCLEEVIAAVHAEGGLAGIHVCSNTDWSLILESSVDVVSFDAYSHFDRFILYADQIRDFLESGRIIAWGIVPTGNPEDIEKETTDSLVAGWEEKAQQVRALGFDNRQLVAQSLITPSCGTGSLSLDLATKVLTLTDEVSLRIRS
ncbi:hypothetical protein ACFL7E_06215 [Thermodesulfobacteriota bacterium]